METTFFVWLFGAIAFNLAPSLLAFAIAYFSRRKRYEITWYRGCMALVGGCVLGTGVVTGVVGLVSMAAFTNGQGMEMVPVVLSLLVMVPVMQWLLDNSPPAGQRRPPDRAESRRRAALGYEPGSSDLKTDDAILMERHTSRSLGTAPNYSGGKVLPPASWEQLRDRLRRMGWGYSDLDTSGMNARITAVSGADGRQCAYHPVNKWRRWMRWGRSLRFSQVMPIGSKIRISRTIREHTLGSGGIALEGLMAVMKARTGIDYENLSTFEIDIEEDNPGQIPAEFPYDTWLRVVHVGFRFVVVELDGGNDWVISCVNFTHVTQIDVAA